MKKLSDDEFMARATKGMKSQLNSQELEEILDWFALYISTFGQQGKHQESTKQQLLQLALNCLPERIDNHKYCDALEHGPSCQAEINQEKYQNAAIDTMEQNIKLKFGGSDG